MMQVGMVFLPIQTDYSRFNIIKPARKGAPAEPWVSKHGNITVTAYTVDYSAFDACAFLIEAEGKRVLYTGDIRIHGSKGVLYKKLPHNVDCLIMEGTNIGGGKTIKTERDVAEALIDRFLDTSDKLNYIWCSGQNIDRILAIMKAVASSRKTLVVDVYVAACMYEINKLTGSTPSPMWSNIRVLYPWGYNSQEVGTNYCLEFQTVVSSLKIWLKNQESM